MRALLAPVREAVLSSQIAAQIDRIPVRNGDRFAEGDTLIAFDCAQYEAGAAGVRAALGQAQSRLANNRQLAALHSIGALEVELARAEVERMRAELRTAELLVERCVIRAPFDGRVVDLKVHAYESVPAGKELVEILDDGELDVKLVIPSAWLLWLRPGQPFTIAIDETGEHHAARVTRIGARIDSVSQSLSVTGAFAATPAGLIAGMSGTALFPSPAPAP